MKTNLLTKALFLSIASLALSGCGSDQEGADYSVSSDSALNFDSDVLSIAVDESPVVDGFDDVMSINLLDGASMDGQALAIDATNVIIRHFSEAVIETNLQTPREVVFDNENQPPVRVTGNQLLLNRTAFVDLINSHESITLRYQYWIDNGFEYSCANDLQHPANCTDEENAANPNLRNLEITVNAVDDPLTAIEIANFSVGVDNSMMAPLGVQPVFAAEQDFATDFIWSTADSSIATVENGMVTGIALGNTTLTVTSVADETLTATVDVEVNNPPQNVQGFAFKTLADTEIADTISVPTCTSYEFMLSAEKLDTAADFGGNFVYSVTSTNGNFAIEGFADNSGASQVGRLLPNALDFSTLSSHADIAQVTLEGFAGESISADVVVSENVLCTYIASTSGVENSLNEDYKIYWNGGGNSRDGWGVATFIQNGQGDNATADATTAYQVVAGIGKDGSAGLNVTADGSDRSAIFSYHKNNTRHLAYPMVAGGIFKVSYWVKNNTQHAVSIDTSFINSNNTKLVIPSAGEFDESSLKTSPTVELGANSSWTLIEFDVDASAGTPSTQRGPKWEIILTPSQTSGEGNPIDIVIDDFSITPITE
ncbi:hypothetical protein [Thalassotalea sp. PLHSN55]|uniref:hypothetical protein n=1 Tax=Thalassotalea sp. PLHSN55 TaxID=3435888 RepID=UPI003F86E221